MGAMSNYLEEKVLENYLVQDDVYLALYTSNPGDEDNGNEVDAAGYSRQEINFGSVSQVAGKAQIENDTEILFDVAEEDWGEITHVGIRDASSGGNLLYHGAVENPREMFEGDQFKIMENDLVITLD